MSKKEGNYWPLSIVVIIGVVVVLIIFTVNFAITNNVHEENAFLSKYQNVDANFNEYNAAKLKFQKEFSPTLVNERFIVGENAIRVAIDPKNGEMDRTLKIYFYLTRPVSNKEDIDLGEAKFDGASFVSNPFNIEKEGRWRVYLKAEKEGDSIPAVLYFDINSSK